ncbi:MAG: class I SAM-dependent methyltransferase [Deltaproteobacteria bacterium]|nr:class I SAM-dependent methyltransferase [Deltaproteobacteria bacterium]
MAGLETTNASAPMSNAQRVSEFWSKAATDDFRPRHQATNWMGHPEVQKHINQRCTGSVDRSWVDYFLSTYMSPRKVGSVVNLGCGEGALERWLIDLGFADSYTGYDISEECIRHANTTVGKMHPRAQFVCADLNQTPLARAAFDVAIFSHSLHHFENLESICEQVRASLRPDGFLLVHEFIGPSRMQWTDKQLALANRLFEALAPEQQIDISAAPRRVKRAPAARMTIAEWLKCDPSECVRSADIIPVLEQHFEILERKDYGGTILQKLFENIMGNFSNEDAAHRAMVRLLIEVESILIEAGVIPSDFTFLIARPRPERLPTAGR